MKMIEKGRNSRRFCRFWSVF